MRFFDNPRPWKVTISPGLTLEVDDESSNIILRTDRPVEHTITDVSFLMDMLQLARNEQIHRENRG